MYEITKLDVNRIYRYLDKKGGLSGVVSGAPLSYDGNYNSNSGAGIQPTYDSSAIDGEFGE